MDEYNFILNSYLSNLNLSDKNIEDNLIADIKRILTKTDYLTIENYNNKIEYFKDEIDYIKKEIVKISENKSFMLKINNEKFRYKVYVSLDTKQRLDYNGDVSCNRFSWNIVNILNIQNGLCYVNKLPKNIIGIKIYPFRISKNFFTTNENTNGNVIYIRIIEFDSWGYIGHKSNGDTFTYHLSFYVNSTIDLSFTGAVVYYRNYNYRMLSNLNYAAPEIEIKKVNEITSLNIEMYDKNGIINFPVEESDYSLSVITLAFKTDVREAGTYLVVTLSGNTFESLNEVVYLSVTSTQPEEDREILELLNNPNGIQLLGSPNYYASAQMNLAYDASTTQIIFIPSLANLVGTLSPVGKLYIDSRRMLINMELECLDI